MGEVRTLLLSRRGKRGEELRGACGGTLGVVCEEFVLEKRHSQVLPGLASEDCEHAPRQSIQFVQQTGIRQREQICSSG